MCEAEATFLIQIRLILEFKEFLLVPKKSKKSDFWLSLEEGHENYIRNVMSKIQVRRNNTEHRTIIEIMCQDYIQCGCSVNREKFIDQVTDYQVF